MSRVGLGLGLLLAVAAGCHTSTSPELRVLGVHEAPSSHVFVQVTNPARRPMRLTKLEYMFASTSGAQVSHGELPLWREIPAGAVAVLEVPYEESSEALTLQGKLTAELDQIVRTYPVSAQIRPH